MRNKIASKSEIRQKSCYHVICWARRYIVQSLITVNISECIFFFFFLFSGEKDFLRLCEWMEQTKGGYAWIFWFWIRTNIMRLFSCMRALCMLVRPFGIKYKNKFGFCSGKREKTKGSGTETPNRENLLRYSQNLKFSLRYLSWISSIPFSWMYMNRYVAHKRISIRVSLQCYHPLWFHLSIGVT